MKFIIVFAFFALVSFSQAYHLKLRLDSVYDHDLELTRGLVKLILHGDTTNKFLTFDEKLFGDIQYLKKEVDFSEDVKNVTVLWKGESNKPLHLHMLHVDCEDEGWTAHFFNMWCDIESGTVKNFKKFISDV